MQPFYERNDFEIARAVHHAPLDQSPGRLPRNPKHTEVGLDFAQMYLEFSSR